MARILVKGLGLVFSGDIAAPRLEADAILIEGGKIAGIGKAQDFAADSVIDPSVGAAAPATALSSVWPRSVTSSTARAAAARLAAQQVAFVDAPVSGGVEGARDGTLAIMAGGSAEAFARERDDFVQPGSVLKQRCPFGVSYPAQPEIWVSLMDGVNRWQCVDDVPQRAGFHDQG